MVKNAALYGVILFLSVSFVLTSGFLGTTTIANHEQMKHAQFGFPIPFLEQDLLKSGAGGYEGGFPHRFELQTDFLDDDPDIEFHVIQFLCSLLIVYGMTIACLLLIRKLCYERNDQMFLELLAGGDL